ncbi:coenzyme Q-binding protein COQ10 homolog, mitochondrial, putative, partial [Hepatocystis sp. ex Piliocolobus tephrosceles]
MITTKINKALVYTSMKYFKCELTRKYSSFLLKNLMNNNDIIYNKNIDIVCENDVFFYTILNVNNYKNFLPYVTESQISEKNKDHLKAILKIENILFKEKYKSIIKFNYPTTIT